MISISRPWISCASPRQASNGSFGNTLVLRPASLISPQNRSAVSPVALAVEVEHGRVALLRDGPRQPQHGLGLARAGGAAHEQVPAQPLRGEQHHPPVHGQRTLAREAHREREPPLTVSFTDQRAGARRCGRERPDRRGPGAPEQRSSPATGKHSSPSGASRHAHSEPVIGRGSSRTPSAGQRPVSESCVSWRCGPGAQK